MKSDIIEKLIEVKLDSGMTSKEKIYSEVVSELNVPRPTVRRIARDLKNKYLERIGVLQSEIPP